MTVTYLDIHIEHNYTSKIAIATSTQHMQARTVHEKLEQYEGKCISLYSLFLQPTFFDPALLYGSHGSVVSVLDFRPLILSLSPPQSSSALTT